MTITEQPPPVALDPAHVRLWLDVLYVATPGLMHISATGKWAGRTFEDRDQAAAYVAELDESKPEGIYLRVTTLKGKPASDGRGSAADSLALPGLWADLDIAGPGHAHDVCADDCPRKEQHVCVTRPLPPTEDDARQIIAESGLPDPTVWVHSGGGLYPWWLLDRHVDINADNLAGIKELSARWQAVIARSATKLGWHYGPVGDLARILRIPGTVNRKEGLVRPCRITDAQPHRYSIDEVRAGLAAALEMYPDPQGAPAARRLEVVRAPGHVTPNDDFEQRVDWDDHLLLGGAGWRIAKGQPGGYCEWIRPGKTTAGFSATTGKDPLRDRLWVFSTDAELPTDQPMTKPYVYALLHHRGDTKAATRELARLGFGTPLELAPDPIPPVAAEPAPRPRDAPPATLSMVDGTAVRVVAEPLPSAEKFGPTQDGMARALVTHHRADLRYCPQRGKWLHWTGHRWQWDDAEVHRELIKGLARSLPDGDGWAVFKRSSLSGAGATGIARQAQSDPALVVNFEDLDGDPWILNTPDGVVDLRTGQLTPSDPDRLCTRTTYCAPDPAASPARWDEFLADTFGGDSQLVSYLQRLVGYSAVGVVGAHVLPFAHGSGGNGKGVFLEALAGVLGGYATSAPNGFLMSQPFPSHETEIARLAGARMVICSEVNEDDRFDEAKVKMLTGGDSLTARFMRQDHFTFKPTHQLWLMGNHRPAVRSGGRSFWRRLRLVPFEHEVPEDKIVDDLQGILMRDHGPALMAWIVAGAVAYARGGLAEPASIKAATAEYELDQDSVAKFVEDCCRIGGGEQVTVRIAKVREAYEQFCHNNGDKPVSAKAFGTALERRFGVLRMRQASARLYGNVSLLTPDVSSDDESSRDEQGGW